METQQTQLSQATTASAADVARPKTNYVKKIGVISMIFVIVTTPILLALKYFKKHRIISIVIAVCISAFLALYIFLAATLGDSIPKIFDFSKKE